VELVAIVGKGGKHIAAADAPGAIFGYCVGNDVTERMWQHSGPQWSLGKSFDTHAPMGPWIVTADEVGDPHALDLRCFVNGEKRQESNTRHLVFDIWQQVEHLSVGMTLEAGDCIFTGTPGGVGAAMDPRRFLKAGDVVRCEIEGLGHIEGTMVGEG
jgi:2-keto-4-pentenoate hydratase/2-oxohepta-3-ene-1,7-dioic acid hydratase in catechol pathway